MLETSDDTDITMLTNSFINNMYKNGLWQVFMFLLIEQSIMYTGVFIAFSGTFTSANMDFICNIPTNTSASLNASLNQCNVWNATSNTMVKCTYGYKFIPDPRFIKSSLKADFQLICDRGYLDGISQSCVMAGFFIGGILGPILADEIGRRYVLFISLFLAGIISIMMSVANSVYLFIVGSLILGILREVTMSTGFVYGLEFIPNSRQWFFGYITQTLWSTNITILGVLAYFIRDWKYLQVLGSIPILLSGFFLFFVPESPRWLITKGRFEHLKYTIEHFANKINKQETNLSLCISLQNTYKKVSIDTHKTQKTTTQYSPLDIFRSKILFFWTFILILSWMFIVLSYYGATMMLVYQPGNKYVAFIVASLFEIPAILLTFFLLKGGRNLFFLILCLICSLSFITVGIINAEFKTTILLINILGKTTLAGIFFTIVVTSVYIYPTTIRSFGTGLPSALGKLFAVIVPYFVRLRDVHRWLPTTIIGIAALFIGTINLMFPDWINRPLPETIKDLDRLKNSIGICRKKKTAVETF